MMHTRIDKILTWVWITLLGYFIVSSAYMFITNQPKLGGIFIGIYTILAGLSFGALIPIAYSRYRARGFAKPTAIAMDFMLVLMTLLIIFFGIMIYTNGGIGNSFIMLTFSVLGMFISAYGVLGIVSKELIVILPLAIGNFLVRVKGMKARAAGFGYLLFGLIVCYFFLTQSFGRV